MELEFIVTKGGVHWTQRVQQEDMGQREEVCKRAHWRLESRRENLVQFFGKEEVMGVNETG